MKKFPFIVVLILILLAMTVLPGAESCGGGPPGPIPAYLGVQVVQDPVGGENIKTLTCKYKVAYSHLGSQNELGKWLNSEGEEREPPGSRTLTVAWWYDKGDGKLFKHSEKNITFGLGSEDTKNGTYTTTINSNEGEVFAATLNVNLSWTDDNGSRSVQSAKGVCTVKDRLAMLQTTKSFSTSIDAFATMSQMNYMVNWEGWADPTSGNGVHTDAYFTAITWNGTSFTSVAKTSDGQAYFTGEVSKDGSKLVRFTLNPGKDWCYSGNSGRQISQLTITNLTINWPAKDTTFNSTGYVITTIKGTAISGYISNPVYIYEGWNYDPDTKAVYKNLERILLSYDFSRSYSTDRQASLSVGFSKSLLSDPLRQMGKVPKNSDGSIPLWLVPGSSQ